VFSGREGDVLSTQAARAARAIDGRLRDLLVRLELGPSISPVNDLAFERQQFLRHGREPRFRYRAPPEVGSFDIGLRDLDAPAPVLELYEEKLEELRKYERMFRLLGSDDFTAMSVELYRAPNATDINTARATLERLADVAPLEYCIPAQELGRRLQARLGELGIPLRVEFDAEMGTTVSVEAAAGRIKLNPDARYSEPHIARLVVHEVDVHALRIQNGLQCPWALFSLGAAGYRELEEGLAVYHEDVTGHLYDFQAKNYAARCYAIHLALSHGFADVFEALQCYFDDAHAFRHAARVKRGLRDTSRPGALTKDYHYVSGPRRVREYLDAGEDRRLLFGGKIGFHHTEVLAGLIARGAIDPERWMVP